MKEMLKKLRKIAFLLFFVGVALLFFNQNSAANVYADSYEDQYCEGEYEITIGGRTKGKYNLDDTQGKQETLYNTIRILGLNNSIKSISASDEDMEYIYDFTPDIESKDEIKVMYQKLKFIWVYVDGFDYSITESKYGFDSDGDKVKDCLKFTISSTQAKKLNEKAYFKTLIIRPYECKITFNPNNGQFKTGKKDNWSVIVPYGTTLDEIVAANTDVFTPSATYGLSRADSNSYKYEFQEWSYNNNGLTSEPITGSTQFNNSITVYAFWKKTHCKIILNPNEGQFLGSNSTASFWVSMGTKLNEFVEEHPDVFKDKEDYAFTRPNDGYGYKFLGFSTSKTASEPDPAINGSYQFMDTTVLYPVWKITHCTISIDTNDGKLKTGDSFVELSVPIGTSFDELLSNSDYFLSATENYGITRDEFEYIGFSFDSEAAVADPALTGAYEFYEPETIFVIWKRTHCTVKIFANKGSLKNGNTSFEVSVPLGTTLGDIITANNDALSGASEDYGITRANDSSYGYGLAGFATTSGATTPDTSINETYKFNDQTTIYAVWKKTKCKVTISANGSTLKNGNSSFSVFVPIGTTFNEIITANSDALSDASENYGIEDYMGSTYGYEYAGLAFSSSATTPDSTITGTYAFDKATTIYAVWNKYAVVTFDLSGKKDSNGNKSFTQRVNLGDKAVVPTVPTAEGCEFTGWYTNKSGYFYRDNTPDMTDYIEAFDFNTEITSNKTVYAGWKVNCKMIGYNGELYDSKDIYLNFYGEQSIGGKYLSEYPDDLIFTGWYSDSACTEKIAGPGQYRGISEYGYYNLDPDEIYFDKSCTVYAGFGRKIDNIEYSVETPKCGTSVTTNDKYIFYPEIEVIQTNAPVIKVADNSGYKVKEAYWIKDSLQYPNFMNSGSEFLNGIINGEETLNGVIVFEVKKGYAFTNGDTIAVNSVTKISSASQAIDYSYIYVPFSVKPEHEWDSGEISEAATCKKMGKKTIKCKHCTASKTEDIDMTEHKWGKGVVVREATSEKAGLKSFTCEICGDAKYEEIPKLTSSGLSKKESEAVDQMNKEIDYLPDADDVTLENADKIKELVKEYDKLSEKQKEVIPGDKIKKLMQAYNKITILELEAADPDSEMNTDKAVNVLSDGGDLKNSTFADLQVKAKAKKNSITLSWKKVPDAKGYLVYGNLCGKKNKMIKIKATSDTKLALDKINGKAIEGGKYYKFIVVAYKDTQKFKHNIALSKSLHVATPGGKYTNVKKLTIKKTKVSIKKGKKYTIKAKFTKENKKLEAKRHTGLNGIRFESSNPSVAKVNNKGVVTGKKKGKATIYVYAQNGVCKKVKITVK